MSLITLGLLVDKGEEFPLALIKQCSPHVSSIVVVDARSEISARDTSLPSNVFVYKRPDGCNISYLKNEVLKLSLTKYVFFLENSFEIRDISTWRNISSFCQENEESIGLIPVYNKVTSLVSWVPSLFPRLTRFNGVSGQLISGSFLNCEKLTAFPVTESLVPVSLKTIRLEHLKEDLLNNNDSDRLWMEVAYIQMELSERKNAYGIFRNRLSEISKGEKSAWVVHGYLTGYFLLSSDFLSFEHFVKTVELFYPEIIKNPSLSYLVAKIYTQKNNESEFDINDFTQHKAIKYLQTSIELNECPWFDRYVPGCSSVHSKKLLKEFSLRS